MENYLSTVYKGNLTWLPSRALFAVRHGSHAYGTNTPSSDLDIRGAVIPPKEYLYGFLQNFEQAEAKEPDLVLYDLRKFMRLASDGNPNVVEVLYVDAVDIMQMTPLGERLLANRDDFLSQRMRFSFAGYAQSQLKRIRTHHRWILHPPTAAPTRAEYKLPERTVIPKDQLSAAQSLITKKLDEWNIDFDAIAEGERVAALDKFSEILAEMQLHSDGRFRAAARAVGYDENFLDLLERERAYRTKQTEWEQYQNWKQTRNPVRSALEEKYHYDTKHASHLVRLLRMCREILETGKVLVKRPDAQELLAIRNGAWTYEQLEEWSAKEDKALDAVMKTSKLPRSPDRNKLDALCVELIEASLQ
jgi:uncharacterized protein